MDVPFRTHFVCVQNLSNRERFLFRQSRPEAAGCKKRKNVGIEMTTG